MRQHDEQTANDDDDDDDDGLTLDISNHADSRVRFEPERTGTPFLFFF